MLCYRRNGQKEGIMYKVINGKRYNTETAEKVGDWWNGLSVRDFNHCSEELYRKRSGEFFLYGEGGPLSSYAVSHGNETSGSEQIRPLSLDEAKRWVENRLDGEDYDRIFGAPDESGEKQTVAIRLTNAAIAKLKNSAAAQQISMSEVIENLIMK